MGAVPVRTRTSRTRRPLAPARGAVVKMRRFLTCLTEGVHLPTFFRKALRLCDSRRPSPSQTLSHSFLIVLSRASDTFAVVWVITAPDRGSSVHGDSALGPPAAAARGARGQPGRCPSQGQPTVNSQAGAPCRGPCPPHDPPGSWRSPGPVAWAFQSQVGGAPPECRREAHLDTGMWPLPCRQ